MLENKEPNCSIHGINFNVHNNKDLLRAAQEGIVFSYHYGMEIMKDLGMDIHLIRAGYANMYLSPIFSQTLASISGSLIELFNTDGSVGAAKGAGIGAGIYASNDEAFASLKKLLVVEPESQKVSQYEEAYQRWKALIN